MARIFIGCSSEAKEHIAVPIADGLGKAGFQVMRWWDVFLAGSYTLESLLEQSRLCDGAVIILTQDDRVWYREKESGAPRDNVLFESGLFFAMKGRQRTVLVAEGEVKIPTDLQGLTYIPLRANDPLAARDAVIEHFSRHVGYELRDHHVLNVRVDPHTANLLLDHITPKTWAQRALYMGSEGAKAWLDVVQDPKYLSRQTQATLRAHLLAICKGVRVETFISMGPGDAQLDRELATSLAADAKEGKTRFSYIPVDISEGLLHRACDSVSRHVEVPFGILGDFEEGLEFIGRALGISQGRRLVGLLGNTFGNLDLFEESLLNQLKNNGVLRSGDYLLLDVGIKGATWKMNQDPRTKLQAYSLAMKRFIANGLARRNIAPMESIIKEFPQRIRIDRGHSDVPGAETIDIVDQPTKQVALSTRRYEWDRLLTWLEPYFTIVKRDCVFLSESKNSLGVGFVLAQVK